MINFRKLAILAGAASALSMASAPANAGADSLYIGETFITAANFCPRGTANANGQLMAISQYQALFSLVGTTYGGDGRTTFALPDLRGRVPIHHGQGPGLSNYSQGMKSGVEDVTLNLNQIPAHNHAFNTAPMAPNATAPQGGKVASDGTGQNIATTTPTVDHVFSPSAVANAGGGQRMNNMQPTLALRYCVVLDGMYPPRS